MVLSAVLKVAAEALKSSVLPASAALAAAVRWMPLDGSRSSSSDCSASRRLTTASALTSLPPASVSGVMVSAQGAKPRATPPTLKLSVWPAWQLKWPPVVVAMGVPPATL